VPSFVLDTEYVSRFAADQIVTGDDSAAIIADNQVSEGVINDSSDRSGGIGHRGKVTMVSILLLFIFISFLKRRRDIGKHN
jgi:hypothetical protein